MYVTVEDDINEEEYAHGWAVVKTDPKVYRGKRKRVCNFSAAIEQHPTDEKDAKGKTKYESTLWQFTAFGRLADYCSRLERGDKFLFYGRPVVDEYWTERNGTGEIQYKINLDICIVQPTEPDGNYGDLPDGWDSEPDY